jgi:hypothetical protein
MTDFHVHQIRNFISCDTENAVSHAHCKDQSVVNVKGNYWYLLWEFYKTHRRCNKTQFPDVTSP